MSAPPRDVSALRRRNGTGAAMSAVRLESGGAGVLVRPAERAHADGARGALAALLAP